MHDRARLLWQVRASEVNIAIQIIQASECSSVIFTEGRFLVRVAVTAISLRRDASGEDFVIVPL
jgi:hypothetical protein